MGGTKFVGRHLAEAALAAGHTLTLFHRGQTNPDLFPDAEHLHGDRDGGLDALKGRQWDTVLDVNGYVPRIIRQSAELLRDAAAQYVFISSISVYAGLETPGQDEDAPVSTLADTHIEEITPETYGGLKVLCEHVVRDLFPQTGLIIRPGLVVGPYDPTDRFTYWPHRAAQGGEMLAPGDPGQRIQYIDARDLAEWTMRLIENRNSGTYNAVTSDPALTMSRFLDECLAAANTDARLVWVGEGLIQEQGIAPWSELPLWFPTQTTAEFRGFSRISNARAMAAGLTVRPLAVTVRETLSWDRTRGADYTLKAGLTPERERQVLETWAGRTPTAG